MRGHDLLDTMRSKTVWESIKTSHCAWEFVIPPGRATREAIEGSIKSEVIEETAEVVYLSSLDGNGMILGGS